MQYTSNPKIGGGGFAGKIDEVHVRSAFPTAFILEGNTAKRTSTLGLWHFNTGSGTTESDDDYTGEQQTAPLPSSGCWTNASGEIYPARYEYIYTYDKVGNRTAKYEFFVTGSPGVGSGQKWTYSYNGLNQLTQQNKYSTDGLTLDRKWLYTYDANGNQTTKEKQTSGSVKEEKWVYSWNPRNQMSLAEKFTGTNDTYAGKVVYRSCLSCDSVLSERIEYSPTVSTTIVKWWRYEYDGLNCLRLDEKYDTAGGALDANDPWRTIEVNTHKPGSLGALICKRVYTHTNNDATPDQTNDYTYTYDAVGNVIAVYNANVTNRGNELYYFTQDAFGNELTTSPFNGSPWSTARTAGITEHQTGKWIDPFTGLYFFHARWYDSTVGRFVGRDPITNACAEKLNEYCFCLNSPIEFSDSSGLFLNDGCPDRYVNAVKNACSQIESEGDRSEIADFKLRKCILRYCNGERKRVECHNKWCCKKGDVLGYVINLPDLLPPFYPGNIGQPGGCMFGKINLCLDNNINQSDVAIGDTAIHEWGHCCHCQHRDMDGPLPPGESGPSTGRCKGIKN